MVERISGKGTFKFRVEKVALTDSDSGANGTDELR